MRGEEWPLIAYADRFSVAPGGVLKVMVSSEHDEYTATVVRLGGPSPKPLEVAGSGTFKGRRQSTFPGSYVVIPDSPALSRLSSFTLAAWIFPTAPGDRRRQGIVSKGWVLELDERGALRFSTPGAANNQIAFPAPPPLRSRNWYFVTVAYDSANHSLRLTQQAFAPWPEPAVQVGADYALDSSVLSRESGTPLLIGAGGWAGDPVPHAIDCFDGKIENPSIHDRNLAGDELERLRDGTSPRDVAKESLVAAWDFSVGIGSARISDTSPNQLHGRAVNMPMRATPGHSWRSLEQNFAHALDEYRAIHFHSDDLEDAMWECDVVLEMPDQLESGVYAVHLDSGIGSDDIPFFVLPKASDRAPILFLAPTFTYLAYGNTHPERGEGPKKRPTPADLFLGRHPEIGVSLYDYHADGSGCCYASRLRPIVEFRPAHLDRPRHFPADLLFIQWLERKGFRYDVITDEDLHSAGKEALLGYQVVITGSHPEYHSSVMLDSVQAYIDGGGKLMYLGGNGFYWVTSTDAERPHIMEVRRGYAGTRTWTGEPGELYHSTTGEFGGLWRHRGRFPNELTGVGFSGQGGPGGSGYSRQAGSFQSDVAFIFEGLADDEVIGDFGDLAKAAGDEVDRFDHQLRTPPGAVLLASAMDLPAAYLIAIEDNVYSIRDQSAPTNNRVRGDIVYHERPGGGAVFSVGSIYWFRSLAINGDENNVSRITQNVLRHFLESDR